MNNELTLNELSNKVVSLEKQLEELKKVEIQAKEFKAQLKIAMEKNKDRKSVV